MSDTRTTGLARDRHPGAANYFDVAAVGIPSIDVREAAVTIFRDHERLGISANPSQAPVVAHARRRIAELVGGHEDRVVFTQNTSTAMALVVNGIEWVDGDSIVVPAGEFPSNLYPWVQLRSRGVIVKEIEMLDGHARLEDVASALDSRTRVLAISSVQYSSGFRYDLDALGKLCASTGTLFVVDGTQSVGALTIDADRSAIDVLSVSAHKWLLGPLGIGFAHLSPRATEMIRPSVVGWLSVEQPFEFERNPTFANDGRRFESGTLNMAGIAGLGASIDLMMTLGLEQIEHHILDATDRLSERLSAKGWRIIRNRNRDRRSGLLIATTGGDDAVVHAGLLQRGIACSLRGGGIRFAPHYYTGDTDIDAVLRAV